MKRLAIIILAVLLCGTTILMNPSASPLESQMAQTETIHFTDASGDYLFVRNLNETEQMLRSLRDYLGDSSIQIQTSAPEDALCYVESTWEPAEAAALPGGTGYCVEAWDIFKDGEFQKTSYLVCRT